MGGRDPACHRGVGGGNGVKGLIDLAVGAWLMLKKRNTWTTKGAKSREKKETRKGFAPFALFRVVRGPNALSSPFHHWQQQNGLVRRLALGGGSPATGAIGTELRKLSYIEGQNTLCNHPISPTKRMGQYGFPSSTFEIRNMIYLLQLLQG